MGCTDSTANLIEIENHNKNVAIMAQHNHMYKLKFIDIDGKENYYEARCDRHRLKRQNGTRSIATTSPLLNVGKTQLYKF